MRQGKKYIHYCWFGDKPLPKLARKCIKSWKKFLPEYEIICWNEKNVNLEECPFVKEAYDKKKWAFVADYARTKAIYEYGGIYLDTDMKITKKIDALLEKDGDFLGVEDSGAIAVGVWNAKEPGSKLAKEMLDFYRAQKHFNSRNLYAIAIPIIVTNILEKYGFKKGENSVQELKNGTTIYPRDYFYPLSYNYHNNAFTKNTRMIHYYDASWASKEEQRTIKLIRSIGLKPAAILLKIASKIKALIIYYRKVLWRTILLIFYPARFIYKKLTSKNDAKFDEAIKTIKSVKSNHVAITREGWLGVSSSTKEMFGDVALIPDVESTDNLDNLVGAIISNKKIKLIVFSALANGWGRLMRTLKSKKPSLEIRVFWHGSNAMHAEETDWDRFTTMFQLLNDGVISEIAFAKKSMYEQYKRQGYKVSFLPNTFTLKNEELKNVNKNKKSDDKVRIGIYSSGDRWVKNFYNQLAAASLIENAEIDVVPTPQRAIEFSRILGVNLDGEEKSIPRGELLKRISEDDIVLYTTFVECAPILPLECLELGTLCITGDNHHYWTGTPLEKYLVEPKVDNPTAIAARIEKCLKHKEEIFKLYKEWKKEYDLYCKKEVNAFLER